MRGKTLLAWGVVSAHSTFYLKALTSSQSRLLSTARGKHLEANKRDSNDMPLLDYRAVLEREIDSKKMTLAGDPVALNKMIDNFYIPVYSYLKKQLDDHSESSKSPLFIGVSAPQGYGKTTLTSFMRSLFAAEGRNCIAVSLDDFYLTGAGQDAVGLQYNGNSLLEFRGNAGTHDLPLLHDTLNALKGINSRGKTPGWVQGMDSDPGSDDVLVPLYDKSLREGRGDRADPAKWTRAKTPVDIVLFEGWMLGFEPWTVHSETVGQIPSSSSSSSSSDVKSLSNDMQIINEKLKEYEKLHNFFDTWLVVAVRGDLGPRTPGDKKKREIRYSENAPAGSNAVFEWRLQAERERAQGLSDNQVKDFVSRFMPAYDAYVPRLYTVGPQKKESAPVLKITVDINRFPISSQLM